MGFCVLPGAWAEKFSWLLLQPKVLAPCGSGSITQILWALSQCFRSGATIPGPFDFQQLSDPVRNLTSVELLHFSHFHHVSLVQCTNLLLPVTGDSGLRLGGAIHTWNWDPHLELGSTLGTGIHTWNWNPHLELESTLGTGIHTWNWNPHLELGLPVSTISLHWWPQGDHWSLAMNRSSLLTVFTASQFRSHCVPVPFSLRPSSILTAGHRLMRHTARIP
jgi:hypothetical protein